MTELEYFEQHEGVVNFLYLDTVGLVTCGVGFMLPTAQSAAQYGFSIENTEQIADAVTCAQAWQKVHAMPHGPDYPASYYRTATNLRLAQDKIDFFLKQNIDGFKVTLRKRWPGYDGFPESVRLGLLDMAYSLGPAGLLHGYPMFCSAVDAGDWVKASLECRRGGVSQRRNLDCADLFRSAALVAA